MTPLNFPCCECIAVHLQYPAGTHNPTLHPEVVVISQFILNPQRFSWLMADLGSELHTLTILPLYMHPLLFVINVLSVSPQGLLSSQNNPANSPSGTVV